VKVLIVYYSTYGNVFRMANLVAEGVKEIPGVQPVVRTVPELMPKSVIDSREDIKARRAMPLKPGKSLGKDELIAHCRQSLANYKIPRCVEFSESELPKDGAGKILKRVLRERFWAHQERNVG
jgi:acyl-CoA synthetase (AMP-forming)/AMP-acid ligase II